MRTCQDCPNELVEHKGAGRPRVRCAPCAAKRAGSLRRKRDQDRRVEARSTIRPSNEETPVFTPEVQTDNTTFETFEAPRSPFTFNLQDEE